MFADWKKLQQTNKRALGVRQDSGQGKVMFVTPCSQIEEGG